MRKNGGIRAEGNFHSALERVSKHVRTRVERRHSFCLQGWRIAIEFPLNVFCRHQRRRQERSLVFHQCQRFGFQKRTMLNRICTGFDRFASCLIAVAMHRHFFPQPMRFIHQRRHLRGGKLRHVHFIREREHTT